MMKNTALLHLERICEPMNQLPLALSDEQSEPIGDKKRVTKLLVPLANIGTWGRQKCVWWPKNE
jgi:hypothetical protein